jgi:mono/diheme cytochrome c family protein/rhodanese-related sulfurtransferase
VKKKNHIRIMMIGTLVISMVTFFSLKSNHLLAGQPASKSESPDLSEKGSVLYEKYCSICHGSNGEGYLADEANALSNQDFLITASDAYIMEGILRGRPGTPMSAWDKEKGGALTREDAKAIVSFIRTWQKEPSVELNNLSVKGNAQTGARVYEQWCAACHGKFGNGGKAVELNNPVFQETASDGFIRYAIENGRRRTQMRPYKNVLNNQNIDDVISFIRTFKIKDAFKETIVSDNEELAGVIREKGVINAGNTAANFSLIDNRFVPADDVFKAYKKLKSFIIIDARPKSDYIRSHIKGAISIPFYEIESAIGLLPKDVWIITYCACPHALSGKAADKLKAAGYDKVAVLDEGIIFWQNKGYPYESNIN